MAFGTVRQFHLQSSAAICIATFCILSVPTAAANDTGPSYSDLLAQLQVLKKNSEARQQAEEQSLRQIEQIMVEIERQKAGNPTNNVNSPISNKPTSTALSVGGKGICSMASKADFEEAFKNPRSIEECEFNVAQARSEAGPDGKSLDNYSGIPGRVGQALGLRGEIDFAGGDEASISYSYGIKGRITGDNEGYQRPILQKITGTISTPISKGKNRLANFNNGFDVTSGTSLKLAFDYQAYEKELRYGKEKKAGAYSRTLKFLKTAHEACVKDASPTTNEEEKKRTARNTFVESYELNKHERKRLIEPPKSDSSRSCSGKDLIGWIFREKSGVLADKKLAGQYIDLFWANPDETPIPQLGWGVSVEYAPQDFGYLQGTFPIDADGNRSFDRTVPLMLDPNTGKSFNISKDSWVLEGYGSAYKKLYGQSRPKLRVYPEGIMGIASLKYVSSYNFPEDAKGVTICDIENPAILLADCNSLNIDQPRKLSGFSGALEGRLIIRNIPVVDLVGFAPKFEYRFDDGLKSVDLPLYVTVNDKGVGTSGIRLQGSWGGVDLLGNPNKKDWGLSIFYSSSLNFLVN